MVRFLRQLTPFFALILCGAVALAFLAVYLAPAGGMAPLGVAIVGVMLVNGAFSFWQEYRAERALAALRELLPHQARVIRGGVAHSAPADC